MAALTALPLLSFAEGELGAQEAAEFDIERAWLADEQIFVPFRVEETVPLAQALQEGTVDGETSLLVMDHPEAGRIALITDQMAYHHVAQGAIAGEPWMVSF